MRLNLKSKIALSVSFVMILIIAIAGSLEHRQLGRDFLKVLRKQQSVLVDAKADGLSEQVELRLMALVQLAGSVDEESLQQAEHQRQLFERLTGVRSLFTELGFVLLDGTVIASDATGAQSGTPTNIADRAYFKRALESGRPVISEPLNARTSQQPSVIMLAPVRNAKGEIIGMVAGGLELLKLNVLGTLRHERVGNSGHFLLTSRGEQPVYLAHRDASKVMQPVDHGGLELNDRADSEMLSAMDRSHAAIVTSKGVRSTDWVLSAVLPAQEAFAPLRVARDKLLLGAALAALLAGALVWAVTAWQLKPLERLQRAVAQLRRAPSSELALPHTFNDEIGDLARDFTRLMQEVRVHQAELLAVQDASPLGLFRCDREGRITYVNEAWRRINGIGADQSPDGWIDLVRPAVREKVRHDWLQAAGSTEPFGGVIRLHRGDGTAVLVSVRTAPITIQGKVVGRACTISDITESAASEKALRTLTAVFEATPDFVIQSRPDGRMTYMNPAARRQSGLALDEPLRGKSAAQFMPPWVLQRLQQEVIPAAVRHGVWIGDTAVYDAQRNEMPVNHMVISSRHS